MSTETIQAISNPLAKVQQIKTSVVENIEIHFGVIASDVIVESVAGEISKRFGALSISDIKFAYEIYTPEVKENWKRPTKSQIIRPIELWYNKRIKIQNEVRKFVQESKEKIEREENLEKFENEALAVYRESVRQYQEALKQNNELPENINTWKGNIYQAQRIAQKFLYWQLDEGTKHIVLERYRERYYRMKVSAENGKLSSLTADIVVFSDSKEMKKRILSDECCIESVRLGIEPKILE